MAIKLDVRWQWLGFITSVGQSSYIDIAPTDLRSHRIIDIFVQAGIGRYLQAVNNHATAVE